LKGTLEKAIGGYQFRVGSLVLVFWGIVRAFVFLVWLLGAVVWVVEWRRGARSLRDERGRPKPALAVLMAIGSVLAAAAVASLVVAVAS
jgi:uncharacterized membrane protein YidH (DUF202 family)